MTESELTAKVKTLLEKSQHVLIDSAFDTSFKIYSKHSRAMAARHLAIGAVEFEKVIASQKSPFFAAGTLKGNGAAAVWENHFAVAPSWEELLTSDQEKAVVLNVHERTLCQYGVHG